MSNNIKSKLNVGSNEDITDALLLNIYGNNVEDSEKYIDTNI